MGSKFHVEKFSRDNDFGLWRVKMRAMLVQQGLTDALRGPGKLPAHLTEEEKSNIMEKAHSSIILSLGDKALREVSREKTAQDVCTKLEQLYMNKPLANRLYLNEISEAVIVSERDSTREWILDSGCSFHMSPHKHWFESLTHCNEGSVLHGNNKSCSVVGRGSVRIKMFDGVERILKNVRYIPELKRNLISLGMLGREGITSSLKTVFSECQRVSYCDERADKEWYLLTNWKYCNW